MTTEGDIHELGRIVLLLEESRRLRYDDSRQVVALAELAVEAAVRLVGVLPAPLEVLDLRCSAAAELANAYRLTDRLPEARRMFGLALAWWREGSRDIRLLAGIADDAASFFCHLRRFDEADNLLGQLYELWSDLRDYPSATRVLVKQGLFAWYAGDPRRAAILLSQSIAELGPADHLDVVLAATHNLLCVLTDLGWFEQAERHLSAFRPLYGDSRLNLLRLSWLEGVIAGGLGRMEEAEQRLRGVREGFLAAGALFPAGMVSLDLAGVWLKQGRFAEIQVLARQVAETFRTLEIPREALAALLLTETASQERQAFVVGVQLRAVTRILRMAKL